MGSSVSTSMLREAAATGNLAQVKALVDQGFDMNKAERETGRSALASAAAGKHLPVVEYLIQQGAQVDKRDVRQRTPLHEAALVGDLGVVATLCEAGAAVDARDSDGQTPLHCAVVWRHLGVTQELVVRGADLNASTQSGFTPLHLACIRGDQLMARFLLQFGSSPHLANNVGCTPLHAAASGGSVEHRLCCSLLISHGADTTRLNSTGLSPADVADLRGHSGIASLIRHRVEIALPFDPTPPRRAEQVEAAHQQPPDMQQQCARAWWLICMLFCAVSWLASVLRNFLFLLSKFPVMPADPYEAAEPFPQQDNLQPCRAATPRPNACREGPVKEKADDEPPHYIICPITQDVMERPVLLPDGHTYEQHAIERWLRSGKKVSPMTNQPLQSCQLIPNYAIKGAVAEWRKNHPVEPDAAPVCTKYFCRSPLARWACFRLARRRGDS